MKYLWFDSYLLDKRGVTKDFKQEWQWTMNKVHCHSVKADGAVPDKLLKEMLDKSYQLVLQGLSRKRRELILGGHGF